MKQLLVFVITFAFVQYAASQALQPYRSSNGKWGYKDAKGNVVIAAKYEFEAHPFSNGVAVVRNSGLKGYGVIDATGREIVPPQYTYAFDFVNGMAKVCKDGTDVYGSNGKWGFIDTKGNVVIPLKYDRIDGNFDKDSYASATLNKKMQIIDKSGQTISFPTCDELRGTFSNSNLAVALKNKKYGMVDKTGKVVIPFDYEILYGEAEGLIAAKQGGLFGFIDTKNNWVIRPSYTWGGFFSNGLLTVKKGDYYGVIDKKGNVTVPFIYENAYPQSSTKTPILTVEKNGKKGLVNMRTGAVIAPAKYDRVSDFTDGAAIIELSSKYGVINEAGKEVVAPKYDYASAFIDGLSYVEKDRKYGFIDKTGQLVIPFKYDYVSEFLGGTAAVTVGNERYYIDKKGVKVTD